LIGRSSFSNYDTFDIRLTNSLSIPFLYVNGGLDYPYPLNTLKLSSLSATPPASTVITPFTRWDGTIVVGYPDSVARGIPAATPLSLTVTYENIAPIEYLVPGTTSLSFVFDNLADGAEAEEDMTLYFAYPDSDHALIRSSTGKDYSFSTVGLTSLSISSPNGCVTLIGDPDLFQPSLTIHQSDCCCVRRIPVPYCFAEQRNPLC